MDNIIIRGDCKENTRLMFKTTILFICGLFGFIFTCSEVKSFSTFQELYLNACNLNLEFIQHQPVRYIYKTSTYRMHEPCLVTIFVILTRKYTWYPYIIVYLLLLCEIVLESKRFFSLWLLISAIRSLLINIIVMLTGLWLGFISSSNIWTVLDFFLFKTIQIGFSASFWYAIWVQHSISSININHTSLRKRRASFHGFESFDKLSQCSTNSNLKDDSLCEYLNNSSHQSDHIFAKTVYRHRSLDYIVKRNIIDWFVKEANTIEKHNSSLFSFDLAVRAERFLQLTPEEIANASKLKKTETLEDKNLSFNALPKLQLLLTTDNNYKNSSNENSEIELNVINISKSSGNSFQVVKKDFPLTIETLLSIFYKYHCSKPKIMEEFKD